MLISEESAHQDRSDVFSPSRARKELPRAYGAVRPNSDFPKKCFTVPSGTKYGRSGTPVAFPI